MTITRWRTQNNEELFAITEARVDIEDVCNKFKNTEPDAMYPACPLLRAITAGWRGQPVEKQRLVYAMWQLVTA